MIRAVLDTNVLVAALRSRSGASSLLLRLQRRGFFQGVISTPLCLEYEAVLLRPNFIPHYTPAQIGQILDALVRDSDACRISFLWRPFLPDADDHHVLETALAGGARFIVTHNLADLRGSTSLGITPLTPASFLSYLRAR